MEVAGKNYPAKKLCEREVENIIAKHKVYNTSRVKNRLKSKENNKKLTLASGN